MGTEYLIDHIVLEHNARVEERVYRDYTSDMLMSIAESMGVQVNARYAELIRPRERDERSADEIALDVIKRAGLKGRA